MPSTDKRLCICAHRGEGLPFEGSVASRRTFAMHASLNGRLGFSASTPAFLVSHYHHLVSDIPSVIALLNLLSLLFAKTGTLEIIN
jgi:hypothetical protein